MKSRNTFRVVLIAVCALVGVYFGFPLLGVSKNAIAALEGVSVILAGVLLVSGVYLQGFEDGIRDEIKRQEKEKTTLFKIES